VVQADWLGPKVGSRPALVLHLSNEPGELSRWRCHNDSTIGVVVAVTITVKACHSGDCECLDLLAGPGL